MITDHTSLRNTVFLTPPDHTNNKRPQSPVLVESPRPKSSVRTEPVVESISSDTTERSVRSESPNDRQRHSSVSSIDTDASVQRADVMEIVGDDGHESDSSTESIKSSEDERSQAAEHPGKPEEVKPAFVIDEHRASEESESSKDAAGGITNAVSSPRYVDDVTSSRDSLTNSVDTKTSSRDSVDAPASSSAAASDAVPPRRAIAASSESEVTLQEEKSTEQPPDHVSAGDTVGVATAENTLNTEVAEEMQKVLREPEGKGSVAFLP